ncbi:MAG: Uncharacterized protein G01um101431_625 [Parcubacteria group bacterium Gr01-1014_31]|nr:MAG: Uncharacterized protein G01um101431_625 [Parcubacteria group bacterium Gr01-1014_31]
MRSSRSLILAAALMAAAFFAAPDAANAQMHCCCDVEFERCAPSPIMQGQPGVAGYPCPPVGDETLTLWRASNDPAYQTCSAWVNPNAAEFRTAAEQEARERSWLKLVIGTELIPDACRTGDAKGCTLSHLLQVLANVARAMLALLGSAAFAMFVYGGVVFLTSQGNQERVTTGRRILTNAVLGILVVLVSWTAVNFVVVALSQGRGGFGQMANIFGNQWNRGP